MEKAYSSSLVPGDIFFHPNPFSKTPFVPESIWLVVTKDGRNQAFSLSEGGVVNVGDGEVILFDQVDFLDLDKIKSPDQMFPGEVFMGDADMVVKSALNRFFSLKGKLLPALRRKKYQMMELHLGFGGKKMKSIKDYHLTR